MPKFEIEVCRVHSVIHTVEADDWDHAMSIASEFSSDMESTKKNHCDNYWNAKEVLESECITYTPTQEYLK